MVAIADMLRFPARLFCVLIIGCSLAGCQPRVALEGTPISVAVPKGFALDTAVYTHNPSLHFRLPARADGTAEAYPDLSIEQLDIAPAATSIREYVALVHRRAPEKFVIEPREMKVRGQRAVEMAVPTQAIFDSITPSGMTGTQIGFISHDIVFVHQQRYYVCSLTAYPEEHQQFAAAVRSLCASVRFEG